MPNAVTDEEYEASLGITPAMMQAGKQAFLAATSGADGSRDAVQEIYSAMRGAKDTVLVSDAMVQAGLDELRAHHIGEDWADVLTGVFYAMLFEHPDFRPEGDL